jgi:hypothetical protein
MNTLRWKVLQLAYVHLWIILFDLRIANIYTKVFELPHGKLSPIISDNGIGNAKPVHDLLDEFNCLFCYDEGGRLRFNPFCEFIHFDEDVCEPALSFFWRTYQI